MNLKTKLIIGLISLIVLATAGVLIWEYKSKKIRPHADTIVAGTSTVQGSVTAWPTGTGTFSVRTNGIVKLIQEGGVYEVWKNVSSSSKSFSFSSIPAGDYIAELFIETNDTGSPGTIDYFQYDSAGPIHLVDGQTLTVNLAPQTSFKALIYQEKLDAQNNLTGAESFPGAQITLGACTARCYTDSPVIYHTFTPVTSVLDSRGYSYITSAEITSYLNKLDDEISPYQELIILNITKSGITTKLVGTMSGSDNEDPVRTITVGTNAKPHLNPGFEIYCPTCSAQ